MLPHCFQPKITGTNDNWRILPLQVNQYFASHHQDADPILKDLDATNGKMLKTIMSNTLSVVELRQESALSLSLVDIIQKRGFGSMHAIIDCGALLAGTDLHKVAKNILAILPQKECGGVLFYDEDHRDWVSYLCHRSILHIKVPTKLNSFSS
jgi:hypothetical protein